MTTLFKLAPSDQNCELHYDRQISALREWPLHVRAVPLYGAHLLGADWIPVLQPSNSADVPNNNVVNPVPIVQIVAPQRHAGRVIKTQDTSACQAMYGTVSY